MDSGTKESKSLWTISIIGSIIGGLVVFLLLKSTFEFKETALKLQYQQQMYQYQQQQPQSQKTLQIPQSNVVNAGYKNDEKWVIERGSDGHIKSLQVVRDAKVRRLD